MKNIKCNHDCLNCIYEDCINDNIYRDSSLYKNRSEQAKANQRAYQKRARDEAKEKGLCIICRKEKATHGSKCKKCYLRQKRYDRKKNKGLREYWLENGLCYFCGAKCIEGKKVCEKHYKPLKQNIDICNQSEPTKKSQKRFTQWHWLMRSKK